MAATTCHCYSAFRKQRAGCVGPLFISKLTTLHLHRCFQSPGTFERAARCRVREPFQISSVSQFKEETTMKFLWRNMVPAFLYAGLLLGSAAFASAQQSAPAADNTKVNARDQNQSEPTAD